MPFERPTLTDLVERMLADINSRLPGADAQLRRSNANVLGTVEAGGLHLLYGDLVKVSRQVFPDSANAEYLDRWASIWGVVRKAASAATGSADLTGDTGEVVAAGTVLQRSDGALYTVDSEVTLVAGAGTATVTAESAGEDGNAAAGTDLTFVSPLGGVDSTATVATGGLTGGFEEETDAELLIRLLRRIQYPPSAGAIHDYVTWALEVSGVTRAWSQANHMGLGTVGVTFVCDDQDSTIIPGSTLLDQVADYIEEHEDPATGATVARPVCSAVYVYALTEQALDFTIQLKTADSSAIRSAVEANLADLILREGEPGASTILISHIREAVSLATDEYDHEISSPTSDVVIPAGYIPVMGTITWV